MQDISALGALQNKSCERQPPNMFGSIPEVNATRSSQLHQIQLGSRIEHLKHLNTTVTGKATHDPLKVPKYT